MKLLKEQNISRLTEMSQPISEREPSETRNIPLEVLLLRNEEHFHKIFEEGPLGMAIIGLDYRFVKVNIKLCQMLGYTEQELTGLTFLDITHTDDIDMDVKLAHQVFIGEIPYYNIEKRYIKKNREILWINLTASVIRDESGKPLYGLAMIEDITDHKILHEKSQKQAEELRTLYEDLNRRNKDLEILNAITQAVHQSLSLEEVYKVALDMTIALENIDMAMIYLVDEYRKEAILQAQRNIPEDYKRRAERIPYPKGITWKVIESGEILNVRDAQTDPNIGPAGRELGHHSILGIPIILEGVVIGVIWFLSYKERQFNKQEIDLLTSIGNQIAIAIAKAKVFKELKRQEEALRESEERYRTLVEHTYDLIIETNTNGQYLYVSPKHKDMLGYDPSELVGRTVFEHVHQDDRSAVMAEFQRAIRTFTSGHAVYRFRHKNEQWLWLESTGKPYQTATGEIRGVIASRDITERKRAEEELKSSREQLRALAASLQSAREEERSRIAREIHDNLGQALTGLKMSLSWLDKKLSEVGDGVPPPLLLNEIASMSKLIDAAIQMVREISAELRPGVLDDLGLVAAVEWQAQEFQTRMGIRCRFTSTLENITLDKEQSTAIFRILQETLTNVARHANATRVNITLRKKAGNLILEVRDNGRGITESEISNPRSLGLLGMRERALLLGGNVEISGTPGKGTAVTVKIPY